MKSMAAKTVRRGVVDIGLPVSASFLIVATVLLLLFSPAEVTVRVGDEAARVHAIGRMGYPKSRFSLARKADPDGRFPEPSAYSIGGGWHLLIWHKDRIERMTHFRHESLEASGYGEWHEVRQVDSFTVSRRWIGYYFVGLGIATAVGALLGKFPRTFYLLLILYTVFCTIGFIAVSCLAETFAVDPLLRLVGVVSGAVFGWRVGILFAARRAHG